MRKCSYFRRHSMVHFYRVYNAHERYVWLWRHSAVPATEWCLTPLCYLLIIENIVLCQTLPCLFFFNTSCRLLSWQTLCPNLLHVTWADLSVSSTYIFFSTLLQCVRVYILSRDFEERCALQSFAFSPDTYFSTDIAFALDHCLCCSTLHGHGDELCTIHYKS